MHNKFLKAAVFYAAVGVIMGAVMGATGNFTDKSIHAHFNLVGWVSMAVMALCYRVFPDLAESRLAAPHFWLHNLGLPLMMAGVAAIMRGHGDVGEPMAGVGSVLLVGGFLSFGLNVWLNLQRQSTSALVFSRS